MTSASGEASLPHVRESRRPYDPFFGSRRYVRGRVVDILRAQLDGAWLPLHVLVTQFDGASHQGDWDVAAIVRGLAADGLVEMSATTGIDLVRLPA